VFGNAAFLDQTTNDLILRVTGEPRAPESWVINNAHDVQGFLQITEEGDGYRSYVGTCMALLVGDRPVTLIDEPELFLYPAQAYELGRFIGTNAARKGQGNHVTFVATHSSHLLRGIIETANAPQVLRLTHEHKLFSTHFVAHENLEPVLQHARPLAEPVLDGVFSETVCLVEADGDRHVYQAALEGTVEPYKAARLRFIPLNGVGEFFPTGRLFHSLRIPIGIIADLDFLLDEGRIKQVLPFLTDDLEKQKKICSLIGPLVTEVDKIDPTITEQQVVEELERISRKALSWAGRDDIIVKKDLQAVVDELKRGRRLHGGVDNYESLPAVNDLLNSLINECHAIGLFIVSVGELEGWAKHLTADIVGSKPERALKAAQRIAACVEKKGDIWDFMRKVCNHLLIPAPPMAVSLRGGTQVGCMNKRV
jgi:hypothetical protein